MCSEDEYIHDLSSNTFKCKWIESKKCKSGLTVTPVPGSTQFLVQGNLSHLIGCPSNVKLPLNQQANLLQPLTPYAVQQPNVHQQPNVQQVQPLINHIHHPLVPNDAPNLQPLTPSFVQQPNVHQLVQYGQQQKNQQVQPSINHVHHPLVPSDPPNLYVEKESAMENAYHEWDIYEEFHDHESALNYCKKSAEQGLFTFNPQTLTWTCDQPVLEEHNGQQINTKCPSFYQLETSFDGKELVSGNAFHPHDPPNTLSLILSSMKNHMSGLVLSAENNLKKYVDTITEEYKRKLSPKKFFKSPTKSPVKNNLEDLKKKEKVEVSSKEKVTSNRQLQKEHEKTLVEKTNTDQNEYQVIDIADDDADVHNSLTEIENSEQKLTNDSDVEILPPDNESTKGLEKDTTKKVDELDTEKEKESQEIPKDMANVMVNLQQVQPPINDAPNLQPLTPSFVQQPNVHQLGERSDEEEVVLEDHEVKGIFEEFQSYFKELEIQKAYEYATLVSTKLPKVRLPEKTPDFSQLKTDNEAENVLMTFDRRPVDNQLDSRRPVYISKKGTPFCPHSIYKSVMLHLTGSEDQSLLLQLHVAIERLINEKALNEFASQQWNIDNLKANVIKDGFTIGSQPDIVTLEAICKVLKINIQSLYVNTSEDPESASPPKELLSMTDQSPQGTGNQTVKVMMTGKVPFGHPKMELDNFTPLVPRNRKSATPAPVTTNGTDDNSGLALLPEYDPNFGTVPDDADVIQNDEDDTFSPCQDEDDDFNGYCTDDYIEETNETEDEDEDQDESNDTISIHSSPMTSPEKRNSPKKKKKLKKQMLKNSKIVDNLVSENLQSQFQNQTKDEFKTGDELLDEWIEQRTEPQFQYLLIDQVVPVGLRMEKKVMKKGPKGNSRRVVDNSFNTKVRKMKQLVKETGIKKKVPKCTFPCDRGGYGQRKEHNRVLLRTEGKEFAFQRDISYVNGKFKNGKNVMKVQPDMKDVIIIRVLDFPSLSGNFEKRCTEFIHVPEDMMELQTKMIVEFKGDDTDCDRVHGNSRTLKRPYKFRSKYLPILPFSGATSSQYFRSKPQSDSLFKNHKNIFKKSRDPTAISSKYFRCKSIDPTDYVHFREQPHVSILGTSLQFTLVKKGSRRLQK